MRPTRCRNPQVVCSPSPRVGDAGIASAKGVPCAISINGPSTIFIFNAPIIGDEGAPCPSAKPSPSATPVNAPAVAMTAGEQAALEDLVDIVAGLQVAVWELQEAQDRLRKQKSSPGEQQKEL